MMQIKKMNRKFLVTIISVLVVCILVPVIFAFTSSAEMVDVYTTPNDLQLGWKNFSGYYVSNGEMLSQENGEYIMQNDGWAYYGTQDSAGYAYTRTAFNTGEGSVMTIKLTIDEFEGHEIGIAVRKSLDDGSENYMVEAFSDGFIRYIFRTTKDLNYADYIDKTVAKGFTFGEEQVHLKMEIDKSKGVLKGSYKIGGDIHSDEGWELVYSKPAPFVKASSHIYVGIGLASNTQGYPKKAVCSHFSINLKAPEGYVVEGGEDTGDEEDTNKEPEIVLPEDMPTVGDAILYETFTDDELFPGEEEVSVANPVWTIRSGTPTIQLNEAKNNRYIQTGLADEPLMMTAGDMTWTDYSVEMDITFSKETLVTEANRVALLVRHRSFVIGGSGDYYVQFINKTDDAGQLAGQYLQLWWSPSRGLFFPDSGVLMAEKCVSEGSMLEQGTAHTLKVDVMDNQFKVYLDDMSTPIMEYVDNDQCRTNLDGSVNVYAENEAHLEGCIGIVANAAELQIDNILVRKLNDYLGGDYDNRIMGNYEEPVPDWIAENYGY